MAINHPGSKLRQYSRKAIVTPRPERRKRMLRRFWSLSVLILALSGSAYGQAPVSRLVMSGNVKVNGSAVQSGLSIASGDTVETSNSKAAISWDKFGRVELLPNSRAKFIFKNDHLDVALEAGAIRVSAAAAAPVTVKVKDAQINGSEAEATSFLVDTSCGDVYVNVKKGLAGLYRPGEMSSITPGHPTVVGTPNSGCKRSNP